MFTMNSKKYPHGARRPLCQGQDAPRRVFPHTGGVLPHALIANTNVDKIDLPRKIDEHNSIIWASGMILISFYEKLVLNFP